MVTLALNNSISEKESSVSKCVIAFNYGYMVIHARAQLHFSGKLVLRTNILYSSMMKEYSIIPSQITPFYSQAVRRKKKKKSEFET